jgi:RNA polymerase sigma-70 factor (ECF subfamily)
MTDETGSKELERAEQFEAERPRLRAVALRMLGSDAAAEDAVQEAWIRLVRTDQRGEEIDNLAGWLTTVVSRICLDLLRSRTSRREEAWPDGDDHRADFVDRAPTPEDEAELADAVGQAMSVVLDSLAPAERLAYVLKDVFEVPFEAIAQVLGRSEVATRQLASRARRRLREPEPREDLAAADAAVVDAFMQAARDNEFDALLELLDPEAAVRADDAAMAMGGDAGTIIGGRAVAEFFAGRAKAALPATLDGAAAFCWQYQGEVKVVFGFTVVDGKVTEIEVLADPDVIARSARRPLRR